MRKPVKTIATSQSLPFRQIMAAVLLVLFTVANYAVQTHIHQSYPAGSPAKITSVASSTPAAPGDTDQSNCPLCQEYVAGGSFLAPLPAIVLPPAFAFAAAIAVITQALAPGSAHSWFSRGPPAATH